jgi:alpha-mannosidase
MVTQTWVVISFDMLSSRIVTPPRAHALIVGGSLAEAAVVRAAYNFNHPLHIGHVASPTAAGKVKEIMESIQFEGTPNVILDTIKRGEDDDDVTSTPIKKRDFKNLVLRVYEAYGGKGKAKISTWGPMFLLLLTGRHLPVTKAFVTNILEDDGDEIDVLVSRKAGKKVSSMQVEIRPFEVVTLRLEF